ncbi:putative receptor-like protein kinase At3g47110 isoform X2 [Citrus sinensis]|uniref:putative receptor-like protein kinase At3g47110 isoform X2 n=1 Tax=Citrus sinensis TaxID=2711 RepID=UPI0003D6F11B|nr:putative receptor-like protein kinase At3g47110 isoform X2 [Citrus sinensis]
MWSIQSSSHSMALHFCTLRKMPNISISISCLAILIWCFSLLLINSPGFSVGQTNETDRLALLAIKSQLHDPLGVTSSWNNTINLCLWTGVTCGHRHQRVTELNLSSQRIGGVLSPYVGNLSFLRYINLADNGFHGEIPQEIGNLLRLEKLALPNNSFSGTIPTNLSRCSNLIYFHVGNNKLEGQIPKEIGSLLKLQTLALYYNYLTRQLPDFIGNLSALEVIDITGNSLGGKIPTTLGLLTNLVDLNVGENRFSGMFPQSICNISSLEWIYLAFNRFSGSLPFDIVVNLPDLKELAISGNNFFGSIPNSLSNASNLEILDFARNQFKGKVSIDFSSLKNLSWLNLEQNNLGMGTSNDLDFVTFLTNCTSLKVLSLYDNQFKGELPHSIANLSSTMIHFRIGSNQIYGTIPPEIRNLVNLIALTMEINQLHGTIPDVIGELKNLQILSLSGNFLHGSIPSGLGNLTKLANLELSSNSLQGNIPLSVGNFQNLIGFDASHNKLTGALPQQLLSITTLSLYLDLSHNLLNGSLLLQVGNLKNLVLLDISGNQFSELSKATCEFSQSNMIGQGSYGSVYKGILGEDEMVVAVKVINLKQKGAFRSFVAECEALRNIRHRNLTKIITICSSIDSKGADFKALVFEYMENGSLEDWLHQTNDHLEVFKLSLIQRVNIAIDVASAIEYLHHNCQPPMVHGDIKPSNVLLDNDMVAHVGDFGLSKFLSSDHLDTASETPSSSIGIKGTVGYVAPEYGIGSEASMIGDVYSFGILLLEMFTGKRPIDATFSEGLTLHEIAKMALPEKVMEVIDPSILMEVMATNSIIQEDRRRVKVEECSNAILRTGVLCSTESPFERMEMRDVVANLCHTRETFLGRRV